MLQKFLNSLTNTMYGVRMKTNWFRKQEPEAVIVMAAGTKAQKLKADKNIQREAGWVFSRRDILILTNTKLVCGTWTIPLSEIKEASFMRRSGILTKGLILKIATDGGDHYQFGLNYDPLWEEQTVLDAPVNDGKVGRSVFSTIIRVVLFAWIAWSLIKILI